MKSDISPGHGEAKQTITRLDYSHHSGNMEAGLQRLLVCKSETV